MNACLRSALVLILLFSCATPASVSRCAEPARGALVVSDLLTDGKSAAHRVFGGKFTADGWRVNNHQDRLYYVLPEQMRAGRVRFEARGFKLGQEPARQHLWGIYDVYQDRNNPKDPESGCNGITLRLYHSVKDQHQPGSTRLRADGKKYGKKRQADSPVLEWDADRWYRFEFVWNPDEVIWKRDDQLIGRIELSGAPVVLRHLYVNNDRHHVFDGLKDITYRRLTIDDLTER